MTNTTTQALKYTGISFTSALSGFIQSSLNQIGIWLIVIFWVIIADLCMGIYKVYKTREQFRPSRGLRDTMGKIAAYFAFVVTAVFIQQAFEYPELSKYACGLIIFGEGLSIFGNFFKAHGYTLDTTKLLNMAASKFGVCDDVFTKDNMEEK